MIVTSNPQELRSFTQKHRADQQSIGFVPTMGALHQGHMSLVTASRKTNDATIMSIFVNPTQFGPREDLEKYPRPIEADTELAKQSGVDLLFLPTYATMYPHSSSVFVEETSLTNVLCGPFRPGHFKGVCTVVNKFLNMIQPTEIFLGQKDGQQLRVIEAMVEQLLIPVRVISVPTFREPNGLAMSSRNQYLSVQEKKSASIIFKSLSLAKKLVDEGETHSQKIIDAVKQLLQTENDFQIQYVELVEWKTFLPKEKIEHKSILAIAGFFNQTRLIDNIILDPVS